MRRTEAVAIERAKLQLEREKFEADRRSSRQVPGFFRRHFEAILTSVIAISAVLVSATQILVAEMRANVEMQRLEQEDLRNWRGDAASFIANNHKALFSPDIQIQKSFLEIIRITYPQELYRTIADSIGDFDDDPVSSVFRNSLCMDTNECKDRNDGFLKILRSCRAELSHDAINLVALISWRTSRHQIPPPPPA